jgi:hypothetical protein
MEKSEQNERRKRDLGHWQLKNLNDVDDIPFGFVYEIVNIITSKKYIGKKQCLTIKKKPPLKGKRRKRHEVVETDWKSYTSSSAEVNKDIEIYGKDNFQFNIIKWCDSKSELAYYEAKMQFDNDVLLREDYYNGIINLRVGRLKKIKKN